jgi:subtilase family protein/proprotein convertase P-domain-containing protein
LVLLALAASAFSIITLFPDCTAAQQSGAQLSSAAQSQIKALLDEKAARTPAQRKIDSQLLYAMKARRGESMTGRNEVRTLRSAAEIATTGEKSGVEVEVKGSDIKEIVKIIEKIGGEPIYASGRSGAVRARLPLESLEGLAGSPSVKSIRAAAKVKTNHQSPLASVGNVISEGDLAHRVIEARRFFGVTGVGVKIGVLSDSVDYLAESIASGELPTNVTVLPGLSGVPRTGEGTAMMEIIHDLAPGAKLYFATGALGPDSFADNIRALRAAGCDIIVDDLIVSNESPFHDDTISKAVEEVIADGALYFSSAGNYGNFNDGTSSVWEGDFKNSRTILPFLPNGTLHDFGDGVIANRAERDTRFILGLWWSDPLGASDNDYDIFIMNNTLTAVLDASTDVQDGDDDPFEATFPGAFTNERILIFKADGAQKRALHLNNFGGELGISTPGATHGHSSVAGAFSIAATDVFFANGGAFIGGPNNPVESYSSDGPRRVFFKADGTPFTPGKFLFSNNGGEVRMKPDLTAADGVTTSVPGFQSFFGTSAAAPHAAAIAALLKSARPRLSSNRIRQALTRGTLEIEAIGVDRDSGAGIVDAFAALQSAGAAPGPYFEAGIAAATPISGDGDAFVEPGESATLTAPLINVGGATALDVSATLTTSTPGVTITTATSTYPDIGSGGQSAGNITPFAFTLADTAACALAIDFTLTVNYANSAEGAQVLSFKVQTGEVIPSPIVVSYTGPPVPIPDLPDPPNADGVTVPFVVSGLPGPISNLKFSFDGSQCTNAAGATTVGLEHTFVGDLSIELISPQGTSVEVMRAPGGIGNFGRNFCQVVLDDNAATSIQDIAPANAPFSGTYKPYSPLSAFNGENGNGTWKLYILDHAYENVGNIRAFSVFFSTFICDTH